MRTGLSLFPTVSPCALMALVAVAAPLPPRTLVDVADEANLERYVLTDAAAKAVTTAEGPVLEVSFGHAAPWPNLKFTPDRLGFPTDWSGSGFLAVTVSNPGDVPVKVNIRVDSEAVADRGRQGGVEVAPGGTARLLLAVGGPPAIVGMRGQPPPVYAVEAHDLLMQHSGVPLDVSRIREFQIFLGRPERDHTILVRRVVLLPVPETSSRAFVDAFGQYNGADWPGKLHRIEELPARLAAEERDLAAHPSLPGRDAYGGWAEGPRLEATGRFRVAKVAGAWWFVDPDGSLFWSSGITCVRPNGETLVAGREALFEWLPPEGDPLARFYSGEGKGRRFDFGEANAFRKYGEAFGARFYDMATRRFRSWGVTTLGCWSDPAGWRLRRVPYTIPIHVSGVPMFVASSHMKAGLEKKRWFPDPFDPQFAAALDRLLAAQAEFRDDPWLLGVFIHNELPWTLYSPWTGDTRPPIGVAVLCLEKNDATFAAKRVLLEDLRRHYPTAADLNRAWGTEFPGWETLEAPFELSEGRRAKALPDLTRLDTLMAEQYFRVCREAMNRHLPGVLYLGCRFSTYDRHIVEAAKRHCDVVSFNIYAERPSERTADELAMELDFPVVIGEFHFGALDRGMFDPGLRRARDQAERAAKYAAYIREAAAAPWCVGAHWFQYLDQPLTGRADGENYNIGFVTVSDDPYPEMRAAARDVHREIYPRRFGQETLPGGSRTAAEGKEGAR